MSASVVHHPPDDARGVLYRGGPVVTVDPTRQRPAEAVATRAGRIVAVGTEDDCRRALDLDDAPSPNADGDRPDDGPVVVDLAGRALLPGFVDAHVHPFALCLAVHAVDLRNTRSIPEVLDLLGDRARVTERGDWVVGVGVEPECLVERRLPGAAELDKISDGQVVVVISRQGGRAAGSSAALSVAGIRNNTPDPVGGAFERDHQSRLTGVCYERGSHVLTGTLPLPDHDTLRDLMRQVGADLVARGITSVGVGLQTDAEGYGGAAFAHEARSLMLLVDELPVGCHAILGGPLYRAVDARTASSLHAVERNRTVAGISLCLDGTLDGHGAWLHEPYADRPGHRGWPLADSARVMSRIEAAHREGFQVSVCATGDAATAQALDLFADLRARHPGDDGPRHRVEHVTLVDDATLPRFAELGVAAVLRPTRARDHAVWLPERLGPERTRRAHPGRRLVDAGALVAAASDAPAGDIDIPATIADLVRGTSGDGALRPDEALALFTRHAAAALGQEQRTGSISEGLRADLVVLSADPTALPADQIADVTVAATVVGGRLATVPVAVTRP